MINYNIGTITELDDEFIYVDYGSKGEYFKYLETDFKNFEIGKTAKLFITTFKTDFEDYEVAFLDQNKRNLFDDLIKIKTVGFRTAALILDLYSYNEVMQLIEESDIDKIMAIKGIGAFTARLIVTELQKKIFNTKLSIKKEKLLISLEKLGYKTKDIYKAIKNIDSNLSIEEIVQQSLEVIGNE